MNNSEWNLSDPYVYQALMSVVNQPIGVQTSRGSIKGKLTDVAPDHIVVEMGGNSFYIRTQQIIWLVPNPK